MEAGLPLPNYQAFHKAYTVSFSVTKEDGVTPIAGAAVSISGAALGVQGPVYTANTTADGTLNVNLNNGSYSYQVSAIGYTTSAALSFTVSSAAVSVPLVELISPLVSISLSGDFADRLQCRRSL